MTKDEIIQELLKRKVIFSAVKGDYFISEPTAYKGYCKNFPKELEGLSIALIYKTVMNVIPIMKEIPGKTPYIIRTITQKAQKKLYSIITNPEIDYKRLLKNLEDYYSSNIMTKSFARLLETGEWEVIYEHSFKVEEKPDNGVWM